MISIKGISFEKSTINRFCFPGFHAEVCAVGPKWLRIDQSVYLDRPTWGSGNKGSLHSKKFVFRGNGGEQGEMRD
jgi:hypothetical protein